ncbi:chemokine-like protein TAFA-5 [Salvelinus namaycush]|uniref:Chemokine-like protein TAFA-5 n=1 Tax=Salvelinus namaycush TaxID=8040 RepID=A0A8U1EY88_SALNM|nr:chemokine-like protein TAFA-5 [Salvelinus namaycush]
MASSEASVVVLRFGLLAFIRAFCSLLNEINHLCVVSAGQLAVGTCEIVMLNRDSSVPRCTIARQTARCACRRGQIAGTTKARPACVDVRIVRSRQWCEMAPCLEGEMCGLLFNRSGWTCTKGSGHIKTVTSPCLNTVLSPVT